MPDSPISNSNRPTVALAVYDINWNRGTGTERFATELARNLVEFDQSLVRYELLLSPEMDPSEFGLPVDKCRHVPRPSRSITARLDRRASGIFWEGVDAALGAFGLQPTLRGMGHRWIRKWMNKLKADLIYYPSTWNHDLPAKTPFVTTIHDMQHVHFPDWWKQDYHQRQVIMPWLARHAMAVTCSSWGVADDLIRHLHLQPDHVAPIFLAPPSLTQLNAADPEAVRVKYCLPARYFIYPAAVWPHKNHIGLVEAVAKCLNEGTELFCVCTGETADWLYPGQFAAIRNRIDELGVAPYFTFTGSVPNEDLFAIERLADFFFIPTLFEAGSYPIWEAGALGKAVACSDVALLPYQVGDAGILFDPRNVGEMADAMSLLWKDPALRDSLGAKARQMGARFESASRKMAAGYHRLFVNLLVRLGRLEAACEIADDPAPPLDASPQPARFEWKSKIR